MLPTKVDRVKLVRLIVQAFSVETLIVSACNDENNNMTELMASAEISRTALVPMIVVLAYSVDNAILET